MKKSLATTVSALAVAAIVYVANPMTGHARDLVFDLSEPLVAITANFTGSELLLFGVTDGAGDVVVVVRGPLRDQIVRKKERISGIWINQQSMIFKGVPDFYAVASNRPIDEFIAPEIRDANHIGPTHLDLEPTATEAPPGEINAFRNALIRNKQRQGLYSDKTANLIFLSDRLFRTTLRFPANVTVGTYGIDVFLVQNGEIVRVETKLVNFRKFGFGASVYDFAHRHSLAYGFLAVFIAVMAGWLANLPFRKG
jgi:uncharacterized protein (TIGR02186 family)